MASLHSPLSSDPRLLADVRRRLEAAGFTLAGVRAALRVADTIGGEPLDTAVQQRRLPAEGTLPILVRLFLLELPVPARLARSSLRAVGRERLIEAGLLVSDGSQDWAGVRLVPYEDLLLAGDRHRAPDGSPPGPDHVTGVTQPAVLLAKVCVRRPAEMALDLGAGGGIQSLLLAKHSRRVVAVDINPRALAYTAFNARLNGIANVECREGSWFEPSGRSRFDLIACNPPYVISPDTTFTYRDSGLPADSLCERLVAELPAHLAEGGYGHVMVSWARRGDASWTPLKWAEGNGADCWFLTTPAEEPLADAARWNRTPGMHDVAGFEAALDRWLDFYRREGITSIGYGAFILRRRRGPNWARSEELPLGRIGIASDHVLRLFAAADHLSRLSRPDELLEAQLRLAPEARFDQAFGPGPQGWELRQAVLRLDGGLGFSGDLDQRTADILGRLDGRRALGEVIAERAERSGLEAAQRGNFTAGALGVISRLYELGFLELSGD